MFLKLVMEKNSYTNVYLINLKNQDTLKVDE